jgi:pimeloyl-ACP methyl ester carboxylesterase
MTTATHSVDLAGVGPVEVSVADYGSGQPFLLLHGGAGPQSVTGFAEKFAAARQVRVLAPTHPGFGGTARPEALDSVPGLAALYRGLLDQLGLNNVTVIGNSIGGWIAAELALLHSPRVARLVLVDAAGLQVDADPVADFFSLTLDQVADLSYYNPDGFRIDVSTFSDAQKAVFAGNRAALLTYGGAAMTDPTLRDRLSGITLPTLVVWGAADRMVPVAHGHAYADGIPGARLEIIPDAGHLPQLETPDKLVKLIREFAG